MTTIQVYHRASRITIMDEKTYGEVQITFECDEEKEEFLVRVIKEILKNDD